MGLPDMVPSILGVGFSLCFALGMVKFDGQCVTREPGAGGQRRWKSESAGQGGLLASLRMRGDHRGKVTPPVNHTQPPSDTQPTQAYDYTSHREATTTT